MNPEKADLTVSEPGNYIPFCRHSIDDDEIAAVVETLRSAWITTGPKTKLFEENFREYVGARFAIAVSSCTAGLHLALVAAKIGAGDEVITTPYTFASTASVIIHTGARPVLVDIADDDFNIDLDAIERAITPRTRAIIPVHFAGKPCKMDEMIAIANRHNLLVIEDAAHAVGAKYKDRKIGRVGDATVFSFYATKNLTTAEGGMITTDNEELAEKIRLLSLHGISKDAWKRYSAEGKWYYEILYPGFKYNMTDIQSAIGIGQLRKLDHAIELRESIAKHYTECFRDNSEIQTPPTVNGDRHAWHLYVIRLRGAVADKRDRFIEILNSEKIGTSVHFIPIHLHPYYRDQFGYKLGDFSNAENTYRRAVSLPLYPSMTHAEAERVVSVVKKTITILRE
jgi:UDP-4-amino-4,6-dideoxy-N-acetyl-beta-L-altrosamine transaminase